MAMSEVIKQLGSELGETERTLRISRNAWVRSSNEFSPSLVSIIRTIRGAIQPAEQLITFEIFYS